MQVLEQCFDATTCQPSLLAVDDDARCLPTCAGSVATVKLALVCKLLLEFADVKVAATSSSKHFINEEELPDAVKPLLGDEEEWRSWRQVGDPVLHIELRRWADLLLVAPLSANSLAKMANGLCDNLLTCVIRAWEFSKPLVVAPAMNTAMWQSPFTAKHLAVLHEMGVHVVDPISKRLACGDVGQGAMASPEDIAASCRALLLPGARSAHVGS